MNTETAMTGFVAVAAIGAALFITSPANAQEVRHKDITYNHEELATQEGAQEVLDRIENAARRVCRPADFRPTARNNVLVRNCIDEAVANAVNTIASPKLDFALEERQQQG